MDDEHSVIDILYSVDSALTTGDYTLEFYRQASVDFPMAVTEFLGSTDHSLVLRLANGNVLNLTYRRLAPEIGARPFDMPVLEQGVWSGDAFCRWFVQPAGRSPVTPADFAAFKTKLDAAGYLWSEPNLKQLAYYDGEVKLLDPFAVSKKIKYVADVLWSLDESKLYGHSDLEIYQKLFADFPLRVRDFIVDDHRSIILQLEDGNLLKITNMELSKEMTGRPWDMPVIDKGIVEYQSYRAWWYVQPYAQTPVSDADFISFVRQLITDGYQMTDPSLHNLGYYEGEVRLLDPFAVVRLPDSK